MDEFKTLQRPLGHSPGPFPQLSCLYQGILAAGWHTATGAGCDSCVQVVPRQSSYHSPGLSRVFIQESPQHLSSQNGGTVLCHYSYFSQQEDSFHIFIFQNIWIHLLISIDKLHQPLQLPNEPLAQPLVLNVTGEVNPVTEKRPAFGLLWVTSDLITPTTFHRNHRIF